MHAAPYQRLAELLEALQLSPADLAKRSQVSLATVRRALWGDQLSARSRARLLAGLNGRRAELGQPALGASDVFPTG